MLDGNKRGGRQNGNDTYHDTKTRLNYRTLSKTALLAFASKGYEARDEAVQNTKVWALVLLHQLAVDGRLEEAKAMPIARFAVGRHCEGRIAGTPTSTVDVLADRCKSLGRVNVVHDDTIAGSFQSEATKVSARYGNNNENKMQKIRQRHLPF